jgi:hypothetical protein
MLFGGIFNPYIKFLPCKKLFQMCHLRAAYREDIEAHLVKRPVIQDIASVEHKGWLFH